MITRIVFNCATQQSDEIEMTPEEIAIFRDNQEQAIAIIETPPSPIIGIIEAIDTIDFQGNSGQQELAIMLQALAFVIVERGG